MTPNLLSLYVALSQSHAVLYAVRAGNKAQTLVTLQGSSEAPELSKGQTFAEFVPNEVEQAFIDLVTPKAQPKVDPMVNRLKKSEVERPVQFVLRYVMANPTMSRKDLIAQLVEMGIATYTARTQVQVGLKRVKLLAELAARVKSEQDAETVGAQTQAEADTDNIEE